jgi:APA family basic amino acid/polyamine antiporter
VTWVRFGVWLAIGLILYLAYGFRHSRLRNAVVPGTDGGR